MLSKLDEFQLLLKMDADYMPVQYERDLFHYTSPSGFSSILLGECNKDICTKCVLTNSRYNNIERPIDGKSMLFRKIGWIRDKFCK